MKVNYYFLATDGMLYSIKLNDKELNVNEQKLYTHSASRFVDVNKNSLFIFEESQSKNTLSQFDLDKDTSFNLKKSWPIKLPKSMSGMYVFDFKIER